MAKKIYNDMAFLYEFLHSGPTQAKKKLYKRLGTFMFFYKKCISFEKKISLTGPLGWLPWRTKSFWRAFPWRTLREWRKVRWFRPPPVNKIVRRGVLPGDPSLPIWSFSKMSWTFFFWDAISIFLITLTKNVHGVNTHKFAGFKF